MVKSAVYEAPRRCLLLGFLFLLLVYARSDDRETISVPVKWCAIGNSPAVNDPSKAPLSPYGNNPEEKTLEDVLWRRHERITDKIFNRQDDFPSAKMTFRSAVVKEFKKNANFPVIMDPCPPTNVAFCHGEGEKKTNPWGLCTPNSSSTTASSDCEEGIECKPLDCPETCRHSDGTDDCVGKLGDIRGEANDSNEQQKEMKSAITACSMAWNARLDSLDESIAEGPGIIAVNIRRFIDHDLAGTTSNLGGRSGFSGYDIGAEDGRCSMPPDVTCGRLDAGWVVLIDNQFSSKYTGIHNEELTDRLLGHEMGHCLALGHGNGVDDNENGMYDSFCDDEEDKCAPPATLMSQSQSSCKSLPKTTELTAEQIDTARAFGKLYDDPDCARDSRHDTDGDSKSGDAYTDLIKFQIVRDTSAATTTFGHLLSGPIPLKNTTEVKYVAFVDLDNDKGTGGEPQSLGYDTQFQGAELVTEVLVLSTEVIIERRLRKSQRRLALFFRFEHTVWVFENDSFVQSNDTRITSDLVPVEGSSSGEFVDSLDDSLSSHIVAISLPNEILGNVGTSIEFQAQTIDADNVVQDRFPNIVPGDGSAAGVAMNFVPPSYPQCSISSVPVPLIPGTIATVIANRLLEEKMLKVFLGDQMVGSGLSDVSGAAEINFRVPTNTFPGNRLVTVGVVGTALTADCLVEIEASPFPFAVTPEYSSNVIGDSHSGLATCLDETTYKPLPGEQVHIEITSGPNSGAAITCDPEACITNTYGVVRFSYEGDGGPGIDTILATCATTRESNEAVVIWDDVDCNANGLSDVCDADCNGYDGLCNEFPDCGMSDSPPCPSSPRTKASKASRGSKSSKAAESSKSPKATKATQAF